MHPPFTILEHPADLGIESSGKTIGEAFANAAVGLMSIIIDLSTVQPRETKTLTVTAPDQEQLLVRFLTEVLYQYDGVGFITAQVTVNGITDTNIDATLHGEHFSPARHETLLDVKAITYHQLRIEESDDGAIVRVYLDI